ncbi:MAG: hypothetical protein PHO70_05850 [Candidatus Omnitrophica bacterium]|nr:hypothetical protein [Candidatus Omnitrophota bacterium]
MKKLTVILLMAAALFSMATCLYAQEKMKDEVITIATEAAKGQNIEIGEANIVYDEGGKLWEERVGYLAGEDKSPNHGILRKGFLKNYKIVLFDFKDPLPDVWVFIDKDTGDVLEVYKEAK